MKNLTKLTDMIYRLTIPYKDIFTTVYTVKTDKGVLLFDVASTDFDVENYIIPMLNELNIKGEQIKYLFISHDHKDHSGGVERFLQEFPNVTVLSRKERIKLLFKDATVLSLSDGDVFMDVFKLIEIPGHSADSAAVLDMRTNTLISGDSLQVYGIFGSQEWGSNIGLTSEYLDSIGRLRKMEIENIYSAHDFHPYGFKAEGKEAVKKFIDASEEPIRKILDLIVKNPTLDDLAIHDMYISGPKRVPPIRVGVIKLARESLQK